MCGPLWFSYWMLTAAVPLLDMDHYGSPTGCEPLMLPSTCPTWSGPLWFPYLMWTAIVPLLDLTAMVLLLDVDRYSPPTQFWPLWFSYRMWTAMVPIQDVDRYGSHTGCGPLWLPYWMWTAMVPLLDVDRYGSPTGCGPLRFPYRMWPAMAPLLDASGTKWGFITQTSHGFLYKNVKPIEIQSIEKTLCIRLDQN